MGRLQKPRLAHPLAHQKDRRQMREIKAVPTQVKVAIGGIREPQTLGTVLSSKRCQRLSNPGNICTRQGFNRIHDLRMKGKSNMFEVQTEGSAAL